MNYNQILNLTHFKQFIESIAGNAILKYKVENMHETEEDYYNYFWSTDYTSDTHYVLTLWIDEIHEQIFRKNNTPITFDRKVKMLYRWYERAENEEIDIYFNNNSDYFENILDSMFSNNLGLK